MLPSSSITADTAGFGYHRSVTTLLQYEALRDVKTHSLRIFIILTAVSFLAKAPFSAERFRLLPDAIAYANIARHIAAGEGFVSSLKLNYFDSGTVTHCALADWPPLYPLAAGLLMKIGLDGKGLQVANALLCGLAAGLVFLIADRVVGRTSAVVAGALCAVSLSVFRAGLTAMSDPLGLALALGAVLAGLSAEARARWWFAAGALAGAACLTRYPNGILLPVLCVYALVSGRGRWSAATCAVGFAAAVCPVLLWKWIVYGSPVRSVQLFHYTTESFQRSSWLCYADTASGYVFSAEAAWRNTRYLATNLFRTAAGLQLLSVGLAVSLWAMRGRAFAGGRGLLTAVAALNFGVYALTPSLPAAQGARFLLLTCCLLLPMCSEGLVWLYRRPSAGVRALSMAICAGAVAVWVWSYSSPLNTAFELRPMNGETARWIMSRLEPGTVVASNNPWLAYYQTGLPAAALPHNLDAAGLCRFERDFGIGAYVILATRRRSPTLRVIANERDRLRSASLGGIRVLTPAGTPVVARAASLPVEDQRYPHE